MKFLAKILICFVVVGVFWSNGYAVDKPAKDPVRMGAYIGNIPLSIDFNKRNGYTASYATWAGMVYLFKNKIDDISWVNDKKTKMVKTALEDAKEYAKSENYAYYAIDNIVFQVVKDENKIYLFFDCNIIGWD